MGKCYLLTILATLLLGFSSCRVNDGEGILNLVPDRINKSPDYWCTWGAQNYVSDTLSVMHTLSLGGHSLTAGHLNEENLFGQGGWSDAFPEGLKKDLILLLDLGWDVPAGTQLENQGWRLGSLMVAEDKFPSCTGTREERLARLNELVLQASWKGTGLWLPSHPHGDMKDGKAMGDRELEEYYRKALEMSRQAGISYWKIDYGNRGDVASRTRITRLAEKYYPGLIVEQGRSTGPLNDQECPWDSENYHGTGSFRAWDDGKILETCVDLARVSMVLRTYDITQPLSIPTTLDRVAQILSELSETGEEVILNCEDEPYIGAVLGCALGILRHPDMIEMEGYNYDPFHFKNRTDELVRAVKWHRVAPAFGAGITLNLIDTLMLKDSWEFREGDSWAIWVTGREIVQAAPARVSRGMPLPEVKCGGQSPYVICSAHPNGAVAVATLPRVSASREISQPLADVTVKLADPESPVGIFGKFNSLTLVYPDSVSFKKRKIFGQDLAGQQAEDITGDLFMERNRIQIPGEIIIKSGLRAASEGDMSEPGLILKIL